MNQFFISIGLIFSGGVLSLLISKQPRMAKAVGAFALSAGCLLGSFNAVRMLLTADRQNQMFPFLDQFTLAFNIDPLAAFFLAVIFAICLIASIYSFHYMNSSDESVKTGVNYFFFSLLIASMGLVVAAANMITFMLSWELMSLSSFFLVIYNHESADNRKAGYLYFIFSHIGAMFLLAGFGVVYGFSGTFGLNTMSQLPAAVKMVVFIFFFIGFGSKAGVFPFHVWLPHAHPAAPSHISAVMSGVMIKTGIYGIIRVYMLLDYPSQTIGIIVLLAGALSGILGVVYALGQQDMKRLLAYSSVENIGIVLIGLGTGMIGIAIGNPVMASLGFAGGMLHILNHAVFKSLLFMGAGMVLHKTGTRSIDALGGLLKQMKITGFSVLIGAVAISGLPPLNGFVGEFFIYIGAFKGVAASKTAFVFSSIAIISLAVIGGLALACFTRLFGVAFQGEPRTDAARNVDENGGSMLFSMAFLAALCVVIGILPHGFISLTLKAVSSLPGIQQSALTPFTQMACNISLGALILIGFLAVVWGIRSLFYRKKVISSSGTWGCGFTQPTPKMQYTGSSYGGSIIDFFKPLAPVSESHNAIRGRFPAATSYESRVNDIAEVHMGTAIVKPVLFVFDKLRWIQHGDIHLYIGYILLAIILLLFFI